jgi:trk system potassium uptake protein TrkH
MTRTAGFNVVHVGEMAPSTLLGSMVLMFIGGAPGSMAGGIKVTSMVLLGVVAWSALKRRSDLVLGRHTVPAEQAANAVMVVLFSAAALVLAVGMLMNTEGHHLSVETPHHWLALVFEAVSAFCTVGLSTGITELLTPWGKLILVVVMFVGRLGPLCLAIHLSRPAQPARITYPREEISVG